MYRFLGLLALIAIFFSCKKDIKPPLSDTLQKELASFDIADGFTIEPVAAEPLVADPVAMEIDENGVFYVVEMHGYPLDLGGSGLVKILKDTDNDGYPDKSIIFADSLVLPTGIMKWRKGVIVTDAPHVWYLEDTNGDDRADIRKKILTGFALSNPQHNLNTPIFGLDNWIYMAHQWAITPIVCKKEFSDEGTEIFFPEKPDSPRLPRNADDRNVRFRPDSYEIEVLSGASQFGHTFDPWGHQILTENAKHLYHEVIADRYLRRNPNLLIPDATQNLPDHGDACDVYPITENPHHQLLTDLGVITSSCGVTWYQGGAFPKPFNENCTFIAEPVQNLIHIDKISDKGASFNASRVFEKKEFLASKDAHFRPCNFYIGPEGALYVVDYYRPIIEHPEWMSDEVNKSGRLYEGSDKGRIYRIIPKDGLEMAWLQKLHLGKATDDALIALLDHKNIWYRRTAQRLLYQKKTQNTEGVKNLIQKAKTAEGIVHGLWLLEGLGKMEMAVLKTQLKSQYAGVRENAIKIAENHLKDMPNLTEDLLALQEDNHPKVRFQLLCTLGFIQTPQAEQARWAILKRDIEDKWVHVAALTTYSGSETALFNRAIADFKQQNSPAVQHFFGLIAATIGNANQKNVVLPFLKQAVQIQQDTQNLVWQTAVLDGLRQIWKHKGTPEYIGETEKTLLLQNIDEKTPASLRSIILNLLEQVGLPKSSKNSLKNAANWAIDHQKDENLRKNALQLLSFHNPAASKAIFEKCITPSVSEPIQVAALSALSKIQGLGIVNLIVQEWANLTPALKDHAIGVCMSAPERMHRLLDVISEGKIKASSVSWQRQVHLMNNDDTLVRAHARKVLTKPDNSDRQKVVAQYQPALQGMGNAQKGYIVFEKACMHCHRMQDKGINFGPDLASIRNRETNFILSDILNPNRSIADAYEFWTVTLKNKTVETGIIIAETSTTINLKSLDGTEHLISRQDIKSLQASKVSAMPEGLENTISVDEMRDLLAYLKKGQ